MMGKEHEQHALALLRAYGELDPGTNHHYVTVYDFGTLAQPIEKGGVLSPHSCGSSNRSSVGVIT